MRERVLSQIFPQVFGHLLGYLQLSFAMSITGIKSSENRNPFGAFTSQCQEDPYGTPGFGNSMVEGPWFQGNTMTMPDESFQPQPVQPPISTA